MIVILSSTKKSVITLAAAQKLLNREERFKHVNLKSLLENGLYPNAYKTKQKPHLWYITPSEVNQSTESQPIAEIIEFKNSHNTPKEKFKLNFRLILFILIGVAIFYGVFFNEKVSIEDTNEINYSDHGTFPSVQSNHSTENNSEFIIFNKFMDVLDNIDQEPNKKYDKLKVILLDYENGNASSFDAFREADITEESLS
ncbi:MAG: hypothetical protein IPP71_08215 [Bacteroidetes bacterium]|nr:hypothetical protein [Bacteroidota bacterium]